MSSSLKYFTLLSSALGTVMGLSACGSLYSPQDMRDNFFNAVSYDRSMDMERDDYRKSLAPRPMEEDAPDYGTPLDFKPVVVDARQEELPMPLVSLSVNQTIALRDIFYELAEQAEVDLELDPNIEGSVIFTAREKPFDEVIRRICNLAGLRYEFKDGMLRIEEDTPYMKTYPINYINLSRTTTTGVTSNSSVATSEGTHAQAVLEHLVRSMVEDPDAVRVNTEDDGRTVQFTVEVGPNDMGRVIGRRGRIANAIRTVVRAAASKDDIKVDVEFLD